MSQLQENKSNIINIQSLDIDKIDQQKNQIDENIQIDCECPICLKLMKKPSKTPCNHYFCIRCLKKCLKEYGQKCPMCRQPIQGYFKPRINTKKRQMISSIFIDEFPVINTTRKKRKQLKLKLVYGMKLGKQNIKNIFIKLYNMKFKNVENIYISKVYFNMYKDKKLSKKVVKQSQQFQIKEDISNIDQINIIIFWKQDKINERKTKKILNITNKNIMNLQDLLILNK